MRHRFDVAQEFVYRLLEPGMVVMLMLALAFQALQLAAAVDPFAFFQPTVTITTDDRRQLDRGGSIARVLEGKDREVAIFAAVPVDIDADRFVSWMRRIEELKKSSYVLSIGRFSDPPLIEDLAGLSLDDEELAELRSCRPKDCPVKLSAGEVLQLQLAAARAGTGWKPAVQQAFRQVVLARVQAYLTGGAAEQESAAHRGHDAKFESLLERSAFLNERLPDFVDHLKGHPVNDAPHIESFVYWSKEHLARKAVVSATHVSILRTHEPGLPDAVAASKEIFATHYVNASLGLTAVLRGSPGGPNYLAYLNRSDIDVPGGPFRGVVKWFVQRRLKGEAATVLQGLRRRLEGGQPLGLRVSEQGLERLAAMQAGDRVGEQRRQVDDL